MENIYETENIQHYYQEEDCHKIVLNDMLLCVPSWPKHKKANPKVVNNSKLNETSTRKAQFCSNLLSYVSVKTGTLFDSETWLELNRHGLLYSYVSVTPELYRTPKDSLSSRQSPGLHGISAYPQ